MSLFAVLFSFWIGGYSAADRGGGRGGGERGQQEQFAQVPSVRGPPNNAELVKYTSHFSCIVDFKSACFFCFTLMLQTMQTLMHALSYVATAQSTS